jgi:hypothetical protein
MRIEGERLADKLCNTRTILLGRRADALHRAAQRILKRGKQTRGMT